MKNFLLIISLTLSLSGWAQGSQESLDKQLMSDITVLTSDSLEGRLVGTEGEIKASKFIEKRMQSIGLSPKGSVGYMQYFQFTPKASPHKMTKEGETTLGTGYVKEQTGRNVIGFWDRGFDKTIVIGAHYDHLGWGDENSLWSGEKGIHRGADDNASGVASMLWIASFIKQQPDNILGDANFLFIAFSGEEKGLYGSNYFCKNPTIAKEQISAMFNMDMVGRLKPERTLAINGVGTSPFWTKAIKSQNKKLKNNKFELVLSTSGIGPSDQTSFYNIGIPAIHFFTGQHGEYHKPTDIVDLINTNGLKDISNFISQLVVQCSQQNKLTFTATKDESKDSAASNFKVTLGVMPDYLYSGDGLKLDGTKEGRPGAKAGLKSGDIIIQMGKFEIKDIYAYMNALGNFNPGDKTEVVFIRDGKKQKASVTFE
jgi:hypothetical protein